MTKEQALELIKLLAAIESWSFADKHRMPLPTPPKRSMEGV